MPYSGHWLRHWHQYAGNCTQTGGLFTRGHRSHQRMAGGMDGAKPPHPPRCQARDAISRSKRHFHARRCRALLPKGRHHRGKRLDWRAFPLQQCTICPLSGLLRSLWRTTAFCGKPLPPRQASRNTALHHPRAKEGLEHTRHTRQPHLVPPRGCSR